MWLSIRSTEFWDFLWVFLIAVDETMLLEMKVASTSRGALPYKSDGRPPPPPHLPRERFTILVKFDNVSFAMMAKKCAQKCAPHLLSNGYPTMNESYFQILLNDWMPPWCDLCTLEKEMNPGMWYIILIGHVVKWFIIWVLFIWLHY